MKILSRPLNEGEIFPCTMKKAKDIFRDTSVVLNFSHTGRHYGTFYQTPDYYYLKNKIKGRVIARMYMYPKQKDPLLSLYVLKKDRFPSRLQEEFENRLLPEFHRFYQSLLDDNGRLITHVMLVELLDGELKVHRTTC